MLRWTRGEGASDCADGPTLERRVEARLGRPAFREDAAKVLVAEVERTSSEYVARLYFERAAAGTAPRTLRSSDSDCAPLEAAVVLALALAIDPSASLASPAPAVAALPSLEPTPSAEMPDPPAPVAVLPRADQPRVQDTVVPARTVTRMTATLRGLYSVGLLPEPAWGLALHVERDVWKSVSIELGLRFLPAVRTDEERYEFGFTGGSAGTCVELTQPLGLCAGLLAGALNVTTRNAYAGDTGQQPYVGLELGPRVAGRTGGFRFEFGVDLGLALVQPDFINRDDTLEEHPFNATAFVGVGPTIP